MSKFGLRDWIILLTLVPTLTVGIILGSYFTLTRYQELNDFLTEQGQTISTPLAKAIEHALNSNNIVELKSVISDTHNQHAPLIKSIVLFNADHELILTSNYYPEIEEFKFENGNALPKQLYIKQFEKSILFSLPIFDKNALSQDSLLISQHLPVKAYVNVEISNDRAVIARQSALLFSIVIIGLAVAIALVIAFRFSNRLSDPIKKLVFAVDQLKSDELETGLDERMAGEFEILRRGLNDISANMVTQKDEMQRHIDQAISDYRETLEQYETQNIKLNFAKREAQRANQVKSDFLAKMSHELRTPLNGVIGFTRQLSKTPLNKHQKDYLDTIEFSAKSLLTIISDILDFSKLEAGAMELEHIHFQLRDTINEALTLLAPNAHEKHIELSLYVADGISDHVIGDPTRFKQILINLISNAIKFTDNGSVTIDVTGRMLSDHKQALLISVKDTGIGIDSNKQDSLFLAFGQADSSITRKFGGTGLGLIITKHLVEAMGGKISLNSALGKGSCFTFNAELEIPKHQYAVDLPLGPLEQKRVLFFEPFEHSFEAGKELLESWQLNVTACATFGELEEAQNQAFNFDIGLLAVNIDPNDLHACRELIKRAREKCDYLYVLVNTISHSYREVVINAGADACLSKPMNHRKLCHTLAAPYRLDHPTISTPATDKETLPLKALVVDDNDANLRLMCALLRDKIEIFDTAHNGAQAVSLAKSRKYDVILLDIQMPIMDGVTACKLILESSLNEQTPIIAVTAHALASEKESLLSNGFTSYLTKPIDEEILMKTIAEFGSKDYQPKVQPAKLISSEPPFSSNMIDWQLALQRAGGKEDLANEMLSMLLLSIPETQKLISEAFDDSDSKELLSIIHKFHGACCYTGVPKIKNLAETIETALKQAQALKDIEPEIFELQDCLSSLMQDAGAIQSVE